MIYMPNSSMVVELVPEPNSIDVYGRNPCYQRLAEALKFRYESFNVAKVHFDRQYDKSDVWIDVSNFELVLQKIVALVETN
jgi:hypothetical protein